jgi:glycosyltransferase involved in cell wall biosynthesis
MRILLLCHGLPPDSVGGVEQHVDGLAAALAAAGHEVDVCRARPPAGVPQGEPAAPARQPARARASPTAGRGATRWTTIYTLPNRWRRRCGASWPNARAAGVRFDVAHVHHLTGHVHATVARRCCAEAAMPTVMTLHDYWLFCPRGQMFHHREERLRNGRTGALRGVPAGDVPALAARRQPRREGAAAARCRACGGWRCRSGSWCRARARSRRSWPSGCRPNASRWSRTASTRTALRQLPPPPAGPGPLRLGYLGTLMPSKGLHVLLRGAAGAAARHRDLAHPRQRGALPRRRRATWCAASSTCACGPGSSSTVPTTWPTCRRCSAAIDVLAAPALWHEAFGLTVREALAAARPVLVSRVGGLQDAVEDGVQGFVLPPGDVGAWSAAIARLAQDRSLVHRMSATARRRARGFPPMADDLLAVYADARKVASGARAT